MSGPGQRPLARNRRGEGEKGRRGETGASSFLPFSLSPLLHFPRRNLLNWYRNHARDLPWRRTRDPYAIWVSEVMLQQTQVATVIPYFERFLEAFPTLHCLAIAPLAKVLRLWEGLGYYRRARQLHAAARQMAAQHAGSLPDDVQALSGMPGFGRYTAAAVLSQAFDRPLGIIEANSRRVLGRFFARRGEREKGRKGAGESQRVAAGSDSELWRLAQELVPRRGAGEFNQALMELGALVCTVKSPNCAACPLRRGCASRRLGLENKVPPSLRRSQVERVCEVAVVPNRRDTVLVLQRPDGAARWAGLWEFPHGPMAPAESPVEAAGRVLRELTGLAGRVRDRQTAIHYSVTRFRHEIHCFVAECGRTGIVPSFHARGRWLPPERLRELPMSSPQRRLADWYMQSIHIDARTAQ